MRTATPRIVALASASTLVLAACRAGGSAQSDTIPPGVRAAIIQDLRDQAQSVRAEEIQARTKIAEDTSRVIRDLIYYWGSFRPTNTHDAIFVSVVAWTKGTATPIHELRDWNKVGRWSSALDGPQLLTLCEEAARVSSRPRSQLASFIRRLSELRSDSPALRDSAFLARFAPPRFEPDSAQPLRMVAWMVWPLEGTRKLSCTLDSLGGTIAIAHIDSLFTMGIRQDTKH